MLSEGVDCHDEILFSKQIAKLIDLDVKINSIKMQLSLNK